MSLKLSDRRGYEPQLRARAPIQSGRMREQLKLQASGGGESPCARDSWFADSNQDAAHLRSMPRGAGKLHFFVRGIVAVLGVGTPQMHAEGAQA